MIGYGNRKVTRDPYLERVAEILHDIFGREMTMDKAYGLAEECYLELQQKITKGIFHDGDNPNEMMMAYYSLCSAIDEVDASENSTDIQMLRIYTMLLKGKLGEFEELTLLEKGIWQFGDRALSGERNAYTKEDVIRISAAAVNIIMDLMYEKVPSASHQSVNKIAENVVAQIGGKNVVEGGEELFAVSVLFNATGYYIDMGEQRLATSFFDCIGLALNTLFKPKMDRYSKLQIQALGVMMRDYRSLGKELGFDIG